MKNIIALLFLLPAFLMAQEKLTYSDIIKIKNQDLFLKTVIEKGYSEGNSTLKNSITERDYPRIRQKLQIGQNILFLLVNSTLNKVI